MDDDDWLAPVPRVLIRRVLADLVSAGDLRKRLGLGRTTVFTWQIRHRTFPSPVGRVAGADVWWFPEVDAWLVATGRREARRRLPVRLHGPVPPAREDEVDWADDSGALRNAINAVLESADDDAHAIRAIRALLRVAP